jgi:hypothetical protein
MVMRSHACGKCALQKHNKAQLAMQGEGEVEGDDDGPVGSRTREEHTKPVAARHDPWSRPTAQWKLVGV